MNATTKLTNAILIICFMQYLCC